MPPAPPGHRRSLLHRPALELVAGTALDEATLREMWTLRSLMMDLKPHISPEVDYAKYKARVQISDSVWLQRDARGNVTGTFCLNVDEREQDGVPYLYLDTEYGFVHPDARKSAGIPRSALLCTLESLLRKRVGRIYLGGACYPATFMLAANATPRVRHRFVPMDPWEEAAFVSAGRDWYDMDPATGLVSMRTLPRAPRRTPPSNLALHGLFDDYQRVNPDWHQGVGLFTWIPMDAGTLRTVFDMLWTRWRRGRR
jgi:hypothetical protein